MRRNAAVALAAAAGAAVGALLARRRPAPEAPSRAADERAEELRRKLAEARAATVDEDDFEAAGSGAETVVEESPRPEAQEPAEPPPADEFEAMRRRIHREGRKAADEMRRAGEPPDAS
jgi:membrane-bound lytic murein transglycosylase B